MMMDNRDLLKTLGELFCYNCNSPIMCSAIKMAIAGMYEQDHNFIFNRQHNAGSLIRHTQIENAVEYRKYIAKAFLDALDLSANDRKSTEDALRAMSDILKYDIINRLKNQGVRIAYSKAMNAHIIARSFGPIKNIDITLKKNTIFIGDQGTGKSTIVKLFSTFLWLEKTLSVNHQSAEYYEKHDRFRTKLCSYHRIDSYFNDDSYLLYEGGTHTFEYKNGKFFIYENELAVNGLPKIMYVPAERSILSIAENRPKLLKELPSSCESFYEELMNAKKYFTKGYKLPFCGMSYEYDSLNDTSWVKNETYRVRLTESSSGIQSALPLCLVSEYLSNKVKEGEDIKLTKEEKTRIEKKVAEIMNNDSYTDIVKNSLLKQLSAKGRYSSFVNIVEEPEISLFPQSQIGVLFDLVRNNASTANNKLVITTHSPYTLAIFNLMVMAYKVYEQSDMETRDKITKIVPRESLICPNDISVFRLSLNDDAYCQSVVNEKTTLISKNYLDSASDYLTNQFNTLYRLYAENRK